LTEFWNRNFKGVSRENVDTIRKAQDGGTKVMDMNIAGLSEQVVFEVMVFQIRKVMAHIRFPGKKLLFPQYSIIPYNSGGSVKMVR
jgi:hypothetical protein